MPSACSARTRNRIELVLRFAMAAGYRPEGVNPAAWDGLRNLLAAPSKAARKVHHAAVPYAELPALMGGTDLHAGDALLMFWSHSEPSFVDLSAWDRCVDASLGRVVSDYTHPLYVGVDASVKHDQSAPVCISLDSG